MIMFCARWYAPKLNKEVGCNNSISSAPSGASASVIIYCLLWLAHTEDQILISKWSGKLVEVSKWMDIECILFWMGQRCFIHITQEGYSWPLPSLRNFSRPTELHRHASSPTTRIITLSPFLCAVFFGVGGLRIQRLGMQKCTKLLWGLQADDFLSSASWPHSSWTWTLNIVRKGLIDVWDWSVSENKLQCLIKTCIWFEVLICGGYGPYSHANIGIAGQFFACLIYRGQHIHTDKLCPQYV